MGRILHFILLSFFLVAGVSQVPACYATRLDCNFKAMTGCPMADAGEMHSSDNSTSCSLSGQFAEEQKSTASFPPDRLKRLKVEQIQQDTVVLPSFVPGLICIITFEQPEIHLLNNLLVHGFDNPHHRPPPLFIQHQSFLI